MPRSEELYGRSWDFREYVIALYFYYQNRSEQRFENSPYIQECASLLGRTPSSVVMRLENYASLDPDSGRRGLPNIGPEGERIFKQYYNNPAGLNALAQYFISECRKPQQQEFFPFKPDLRPKAFDGKYDLMDKIGEGGFGTVYSCVEVSTSKILAIKMIRFGDNPDSDVRGRFRREIRALRAISHPNVIRIHEDSLLDEHEYPAYVMDFAETSLSCLLEESRQQRGADKSAPIIQREHAKEILYSVISAVEALHNSTPPLIHRDINPSNILRLTDGRWVLADFSLVKFLPPGSGKTTYLTQGRKGAGTHQYAAPEQWDSFDTTDQRADIHSLGVLLWELFDGSEIHLLYAKPNLPKLSRELAAVVNKATEKNPEGRYETVGDFRVAVEIAMHSAR